MYQFRKIVSKNPATGMVLKSIPFISLSNLEFKIKNSEIGFQKQQALSIKERVDKLNCLASTLAKKQEQIAKIITLEVGKPLAQSAIEVTKSITQCQYYAKNLPQFLSPKLVETDAKKSYVQLQPIGTIYQIVPFNFPFWLTFKPAVPSIALGNTILLRNSDSTPQVAELVEQIFKESGYTNFEFQNVYSCPSQLDFILAHKAVQGVSFTGSSATGALIASTAGKYIKKSLLELGGCDPFIVLQDADIDYAVDMCVRSRSLNCGQVCIASKRFIVHEKVYDEFKSKLISAVKKIKIGDPNDPATQMGPMARDDLVESLHELVQDSVDQGATLLYGGHRIKGIHPTGFYYSPTVLEIACSSLLSQSESFGPIFALIRVNSTEEAIQVANDNKYGLGATVVTRNVPEGERVALLLNSGSVFVNDVVRSDSRLPSGGVRLSGYGRECGEYGIQEFANIKSLFIK